MSVADRRAALELHPLAVRDREWVLGQLAAPERMRLEALLTELDGMDLRFDLTGEDAQAEGAGALPANGQAPAAAEASSPLAVLRRASPAVMIRLLSEEPAWLVAAVLRIEPWPWAAAVRAALADTGPLPEPTLVGPRPLPPGLAAALPPLLVARLLALGRASIASMSTDALPGAHPPVAVWRLVRDKVVSWLK